MVCPESSQLAGGDVLWGVVISGTPAGTQAQATGGGVGRAAAAALLALLQDLRHYDHLSTAHGHACCWQGEDPCGVALLTVALQSVVEIAMDLHLPQVHHQQCSERYCLQLWCSGVHCLSSASCFVQVVTVHNLASAW